MQNRVTTLLNLGHDLNDDVKYVLNSAHDDQIANMVWWLDAVDYEITDVPYASSIHYELHYDSECLTSPARNESCFEVHVTHDGRPLKFDTCLVKNHLNGSKSSRCLYPDFKEYMQKISS